VVAERAAPPSATGDTLLPPANGWYQVQVTEAGLGRGIFVKL